ncbi:MAG: hypothetical protein ACN6O8_09950 [Achromobacter sp.]|uniref:hypothetical protein n=1 Tax=Achromobacter sp. TaxID=134375 RepID=UPI003CFDB4E6
MRRYRFARQDIEARYGRGNFDDGGGHVVEALGEVLAWENQYPLAFGFDTAHANPWHHALVAMVTGMPDDVARHFADRMRALGLPPPRSAD